MDDEKEDDFKLKPEQEAAVNEMKKVITQGDLLFAILQGSAGSGKTTICKELAKELGLKVLFTASTGSAAALLNTVTINSLLNLGRSKDFCTIDDDYINPRKTKGNTSKILRRLGSYLRRDIL